MLSKASILIFQPVLLLCTLAYVCSFMFDFALCLSVWYVFFLYSVLYIGFLLFITRKLEIECGATCAGIIKVSYTYFEDGRR